jgi:hypothetical protein
VAAPSEACPACGAPTEPGQEYCLDCGARLAPARRVSAVGRAWQRRFGRYPGDWLLASLLLALVAAGSAAAGIVAGRETPKDTIHTIVATSQVVTAPIAPPALGRPKPQPKTKPAAKPKTATAPKTATGLTEWPARNGYTVILASIPARGAGQDAARSKAKTATQSGVGTVGVLVSSRFASLHPGYYVVFAGIYDSLEEAQTAATRLHGRFPNAYARQIAH